MVTTMIRIRVQVNNCHTEGGLSPPVGESEPIDSGSESDVPDLIDSKGDMVL